MAGEEVPDPWSTSDPWGGGVQADPANENTLRSELLLPMTNRGMSKEAGTQRQGLPPGLGPGKIGTLGSNTETAEAPKTEAAMAATTLPTATEHPTGRALHGTRAAGAAGTERDRTTEIGDVGIESPSM